MKKFGSIIIVISIIVGCSPAIKNENPQIVVEEGTETDATIQKESTEVDLDSILVTEIVDTKAKDYWVGFFDPHKDVDMDDKYVFADEGLSWNRRNKISISIDTLIGDSVIGHSIVAGNHRPFYGNYILNDNVKEYTVQEPGDDKYDGRFSFNIIDDKLIGVWEAYEAIEIPKREYRLSQKTFKYNPDIMLSMRGAYGDWNKFIDHGTQYEVVDEGTPDEEVYEWIQKEYASSTAKIYELNASNTLLTKEDVENLTNSDLVVIRNTIYARHGYSFKNRPLRMFFDEQEWYIPVHADIKQDFTEIEMKNIQLLLKYEKNAKEYYDYFGRG